MPAQSPSDGTPPPAVSPASPAEQLADERTERRRQRAAAHDVSAAPRQPRRAGRREPPTRSTSAPTPARRMTLRDSASVTLIAVLAMGGILGAILGAVGAPGWIIGLLVAGLTVVVSAMLRRYSRSS